MFEEPKYPYLYFVLNVYDTIFVGDDEKPIYGDDGGVPGGKLFVRFDHSRENGIVILKNGIVEYQETELVKVDPFGIGGKINGGDMIKAGVIDILPILKWY